MGDDIFDILEIPRPDPDLKIVSYLWPTLSEEMRRTIREQVEQYTAQNPIE